MPKPVLVPTTDDDLEQGMAKLTAGLQQVQVAKEETEQRGIILGNQTREMLQECERRVQQIDVALAAEDELIERAERGIEDLTEIKNMHTRNHDLLLIEKAIRLHDVHELRSQGVTG